MPATISVALHKLKKKKGEKIVSLKEFRIKA